MNAATTDAGFQTIGQETARAIVTRAAALGRLGRTLLIHGPPGAGKGAFVDDLLALLLCVESDAARRPCNACASCRQARTRSHPDLLIGGPAFWREQRAGGESIVAAARRWLLEASGTPVAGDRRLLLIEDADRANEQTQNSLLKALEEPGERHTFLLTADDPERLLPTIRSRCQPLRIGPVPREELTTLLVERERLPADQAQAIARLAGLLPGAAVRLARDPDRIAWRRRTEKQLLDLVSRGRAERFASVRDLLDDASRLAPTGDVAEEGDTDPGRVTTAAQRGAAGLVLDAWLGLARDLLLASVGRSDLAAADELHPEIGPIADRLGSVRIARSLGELDRIRSAVANNAAPRLAMEVAMLRWPTLDQQA